MRLARVIVSIPLPANMAEAFAAANVNKANPDPRHAAIKAGVIKATMAGLAKGMAENVNARTQFVEIMQWLALLGMTIQEPGSTIVTQVMDMPDQNPDRIHFTIE